MWCDVLHGAVHSTCVLACLLAGWLSCLLTGSFACLLACLLHAFFLACAFNVKTYSQIFSYILTLNNYFVTVLGLYRTCTVFQLYAVLI